MSESEIDDELAGLAETLEIAPRQAEESLEEFAARIVFEIDDLAATLAAEQADVLALLKHLGVRGIVREVS
jgi:hypothetical protein